MNETLPLRMRRARDLDTIAALREEAIAYLKDSPEDGEVLSALAVMRHVEDELKVASSARM